MLSQLLYLFPFYVCLFWASLLLLSMRKNCKAQNIWILVMVVLSINTYCWLHTNLPVLELYAGSIYYTLILFYALAVMQEVPFNWKVYLWLLLPLCIGVTGYYWLIVVQIIIELPYIVWQTIRYRRRLEQYYSCLDEKLLGHIYSIPVYMLLMSVPFFVRMDLVMGLMAAVNFFMSYRIYRLAYI